MVDVAVIGAGPGGYVAAVRAAQRGAKVAVFERGPLGGVCLNWGCIPSKTFLHGAHVYDRVTSGRVHGMRVSDCTWDHGALLAWKAEVVKRNQGGIANLFKGHGIDLIPHEATITGPDTIAAGGETYTARSIIVATGASPRALPHIAPDGDHIMTSRAALDLPTVPASVAVIGGGAIGCEFASFWRAVGAEVTLLEKLPRILPLEDEDISKAAQREFKKRGIAVHCGVDISDVQTSDSGVTMTVSGPESATISVERVLLAVGVSANADVFGEGAVKPNLDARGFIEVDERLATSIPGIYAIGDVTGTTLLAHGASAEGVVAAENAAGGNSTMRYDAVPAVTFSDPEVAHVGLTEEAARNLGHSVKTGQFAYAASGRAAALDETAGLVKIVGDAETDELLGVHIVGVEAGELIAAAAVAKTMEATVEELARTVFPHPTLSEMLREAAEDYYGESIHTPPRRGRARASA